MVWSDSQIVLHWLKSVRPLPIFVSNRLKEIRQHTQVEFRYINTENNPADLATRGKVLSELRKNALWWTGPSWLTLNETDWPTFNLPPIHSSLLAGEGLIAEKIGKDTRDLQLEQSLMQNKQN